MALVLLCNQSLFKLVATHVLEKSGVSSKSACVDFVNIPELEEEVFDHVSFAEDFVVSVCAFCTDERAESCICMRCFFLNAVNTELVLRGACA